MKPKHSGTPTTPNAKRGRPMVTITLSPEGLAKIDRRRMRAKISRGAYIEWLLDEAERLAFNGRL